MDEMTQGQKKLSPKTESPFKERAEVQGLQRNLKGGKEIRGEIRKVVSQDGQVSRRKIWSPVSHVAKLRQKPKHLFSLTNRSQIMVSLEQMGQVRKRLSSQTFFFFFFFQNGRSSVCQSGGDFFKKKKNLHKFFTLNLVL